MPTLTRTTPHGHQPWPRLQRSVGEGAHNDPDEVRQVKRRLVELGFDWIDDSPDGLDPAFLQALRLFQAITQGHQRVQGAGVDGRVDPSGHTLAWLQARNAPQWRLLPNRGEGFINVERQDTRDDHDYGTSWLDDVIAAAGRHYQQRWRAQHPQAAPIQINDASRPCGGDTPDHGGHETGLDVDLRLPRDPSGAFDLAAMRAALRAFRAQPLVTLIYFNNPTLIAEGLCAHLQGHDDHAHVHTSPPPREP